METPKTTDVAHVEALSTSDHHAMRDEKLDVVDLMLVDTERAPEARGHDLNDLPRNYWYSPGFIGSYLAVGFAFTAGIGGYALAAPLLANINDDIGPSSNIAWFLMAWILCQGIGNLIAVRVNDIFGRRWVFIMGSLLGLIGSIIAATAQSVNALVGAAVIMGLGGGIQISWFWAISELVPMKWRYLANSGAYVMAFPTSPLAPKIAYTIQHTTSVKWRGCFYLVSVCNAFSVFLWYTFYRPPTFKMLHRRRALKELLIGFDWVGPALYAASAWTFLMGITWGGGQYPWKSGHVIGSILAGAFGFVLLPLWEAYLPIKGTYPFPAYLP